MARILDTFYRIDSQFIRFIFVGMLNTAFGVGVYCLLIWLGIPYQLATLMSTVLGVLFNFKTIGVLVFENKDNSLIFRFALCYVVAYFINIGIIWLFKHYLNDYWSGILATPFVAVFSFLFQKTFVYKK